MLTTHASIDLHISEIHVTIHRHEFSGIEWHSVSEISRVLVVHDDLWQSNWVGVKHCFNETILLWSLVQWPWWWCWMAGHVEYSVASDLHHPSHHPVQHSRPVGGRSNVDWYARRYHLDGWPNWLRICGRRSPMVSYSGGNCRHLPITVSNTVYMYLRTVADRWWNLCFIGDSLDRENSVSMMELLHPSTPTHIVLMMTSLLDNERDRTMRVWTEWISCSTYLTHDQSMKSVKVLFRLLMRRRLNMVAQNFLALNMCSFGVREKKRRR